MLFFQLPTGNKLLQQVSYITYAATTRTTAKQKDSWEVFVILLKAGSSTLSSPGLELLSGLEIVLSECLVKIMPVKLSTTLVCITPY